MQEKQEIGKFGEDLACAYLVGKRFKILGRNVRKKWGEIDTVAKDKDGTLVFVEVKTMKKHPELKPEDNLTKAKLGKLQRFALLFAGSHPELVDEKKGWRIDLVAITIPEETDDLTKSEKDCDIKHYLNI